MGKWLFLAFSSMFLISACGDDDVNSNCVELLFDEPVWQEGLNFIETTNTPSVQIDRYVAANNLDTIQTASGLVYSIIETGGVEKPTTSSTVVAWFKGYLTNGDLFDQSNTCNGPLELPLSDLISAWQEGIPKIGRGGKMIILARPSLAFENRSPSNGTRVLIFEVDLLDF